MFAILFRIYNSNPASPLPPWQLYKRWFSSLEEAQGALGDFPANGDARVIAVPVVFSLNATFEGPIVPHDPNHPIPIPPRY